MATVTGLRSLLAGLALFAGVISVSGQSSSPSERNPGKPESKRNAPRRPLEFADPKEMLKLIEGRWRTAGNDCEANAFTIIVSADQKYLDLEISQPGSDQGSLYRYDILELENDYFRTQIRNEKRLTDAGKPVKWDFIFLSNDEFVWRQSDSPRTAYTKPLLRCRET